MNLGVDQITLIPPYFRYPQPGADTHSAVPNSSLIVACTATKFNTSWHTLNSRLVSYTEVQTVLQGHGIDLTHKCFLILQGEVKSIAQMKPEGTSEHQRRTTQVPREYHQYCCAQSTDVCFCRSGSAGREESRECSQVVMCQSQQPNQGCNATIYLNFTSLGCLNCCPNDKEAWHVRAKSNSKCIMGIKKQFCMPDSRDVIAVEDEGVTFTCGGVERESLARRVLWVALSWTCEGPRGTEGIIQKNDCWIDAT
ncbi:uncharacterized protein F5891DRAFT_985166 [Suillus fuscotomentosus]|uniref:Uncharacterized protein n=1 Tax=Suillus fuscotomentosus TaxID=1912939 RepID=A0AAD4HF70_9AGAM|nr:uncharacterized protein F5891DRAFT_985166 [Suillus fuscotomentosus]KAG1894282.1 hypothetical protein F5891DRAFT_985166 [Suillus fuscotomentosus]